MGKVEGTNDDGRVPKSGPGLSHGAVMKGAGGFAGGVAALGGGAVIVHVLAFGSLPIISRLFGPEAFGVAAMMIAVMTMAGAVAPLRYESALMLPASDGEAANLLAVCVVAVVAASGLTVLVLAIWGDAILACLKVGPARSYYRWVLPAGVLTFGMGFVLRAWNTRHRHFKRLSVLNVGETFTSVTTKVAGGAAGLSGPGTLIFSHLAARSVPAAVLACKLLRDDAGFIVSHCRWRLMASLARRYVRFPLIDIWSSLLSQASYHFPFLLLGGWLGTAVAGHYSRALIVVQLPLLLVGNAVGQVFFQRAAARQASGRQVSELVEQVLHRLIWISVLPMAAVAMFGPELFTVILGGQWARAGAYAQLLTAWVFPAALALPLLGLLSVLGRLGHALAFHLTLVGGQVAALVIGGRILHDDRQTMALLAIAGAAAHLWLLAYLLRAAKAPFRAAWRQLARYVICALPTLGAGALAKWWFQPAPWLVVAALAGASISYWALVVCCDAWARAALARAAGRIASKRAS